MANPKCQRLGYVADNDLSLIAYHRDYPGGREVDLNRTALREIAEQGYTEHPGMLGINLWGAGADADIERRRADFESGRTPPFNFEKWDRIIASRNGLKSETNKDHQEQEAQKMRDQRVKDAKTIPEEAQRSDEMYGDEKSDAEKLRRKEGGRPTNLSGAVRQAELARQAEATKQPQTKTLEQSEEELRQENEKKAVLAEKYNLHRTLLVDHGASLGIPLTDIEALLGINHNDIDSLTDEQFAQACDAVTQMAKVPKHKRTLPKGVKSK